MKKITSKPRVVIIGIDGLVPQLVFERYKKELPTFYRLMQNGTFGHLKSTVPPTSIVAWTSLNSGGDPSQTGIHSYTSRPKANTKTTLTTSQNVKVPLLWDILGKHNKQTVALNIPLTYPARPLNGYMVTDFLTPAFDDKSVYPLAFKKTIKKLLGGKDYLFDVSGFTGYKKLDLDVLIKRTYEMTDMHFKVAQYLWEKTDWDLFNMVIIGSDRLHHMFWRHIDPQHPLYVRNSKYKNVILDFYKYLDNKLAELLVSPKINPSTLLIIASDHGMDRMTYRFNLNDWLLKQGYLAIKPEFKMLYEGGPRKLAPEHINWRQTRALASGGYQGRIYLFGKSKNKLADELVRKLKKIKGKDGEKLENHCFNTAQIYKKRDPEAPEVIVFFDNLRYGINNDIGNEGYYSLGTSVGIDDAGHALAGSLIIWQPEKKGLGEINEQSILQVTPTVLRHLEIKNKNKIIKPINYHD